jgi:hypothetical protein
VIPDIISPVLCYHPRLDREIFKQAGLTFPAPANILVCRCGANQFCNKCGWNISQHPCKCDSPPVQYGAYNMPSGVVIPYIAPRIG